MAPGGHAEPSAEAPAASRETPPPSPVERVRALLAARCAECDQDRFGNGLGLDDLAEDPHYVTPARPDASLIYRRMLAGFPAFGVPATGSGPPAEPPDAADIEAVRDWIATRPAREDACRGRKPVTSADVEVAIGRWLRSLGPKEALDTRFISLADLWNACAPQARMDEAREALGFLLAALARHRDPPHVERLGEGVVIAVRTGALFMLDGEWERMTKEAPRATTSGAVPADWLASHLLSGVRTASGAPDPTFAVRFDGAGQRAVSALARMWDRDLDLVRAAAEWGAPPHELRERLAGLGGSLRLDAARLAYGALSRAGWDRLERALEAGEQAPVVGADPPAPETSGGIDIVLAPDRPVYRPRESASFTVTVGTSCHLTLINIDDRGKAIVLFPNDLESDNLIAPGVSVRVPASDAAYRFRFDTAGEENFVAICQRKARRPDGIVYDHEKQRFAVLGDWEAFMRGRPQRIAAARAHATEDEASSRRRRRHGAPVEKEQPAIDPDGPAVEGRTAIAVTVEPAGSL